MKQKDHLILFFITVFLGSWILWSPSVLLSLGYQVPTLFLFIGMFASFVPSIAGLVLTRVKFGKTEMNTMLKSAVNFKFPLKWLLIVLFFQPILIGASYFIAKSLGYAGESVYLNNPVTILFVFLQIFFVGGALGEEFGWRGYALPKLQKRFSPLIATLILGLIWGVWHLPLFFISGTVQSFIPFWEFIVQTILLTLVYTWVFNHTKGNLFLMILLHAVGNTASAIFPFWQTGNGRWIGFGILLIAILIYPIRHLNKPTTE